jgi:uncharacterized protein (DUF433 family)
VCSRHAADSVLHILAENRDREEIRKDYPRLDDEDIRHVLLYVAASVDSRSDDVTDWS